MREDEIMQFTLMPQIRTNASPCEDPSSHAPIQTPPARTSSQALVAPSTTAHDESKAEQSSASRRPAWANQPVRSPHSRRRVNQAKTSFSQIAVSVLGVASVLQGARASEPNMLVGMIDNGVDYNHPALKEYLTPGEGLQNYFVHDVVDHVMPPEKHGTHVAGIIAGRAGGEELPSDVKLVPLRALSEKKNTTSDTVERAIYLAKALQLRIVNLSISVGNPADGVYNAMKSAAEILFVVSAGNDGKNLTTEPAYPPSYNLTNMLVVAATDKKGKLADYSNYGGNAAIAAPGTLNSTLPENSYGELSGTSMAAPYVVNLLIQELEKNRNLTNEELISLVKTLPGLTPTEELTTAMKNLAADKNSPVTAPLFVAASLLWALYGATQIRGI